MRTVSLGNTGVQVSAFCLGAMYFGSSTDRETSIRLLDLYVEAGGTFIDTANAYARWVPGCQGGESEAVLAGWMRDRRNRSKLFIASKVGFPAPVDGLDRGLRAWQIERACEASLKRLGIETLDLYYAHNDDRDAPVEERLRAFDQLVRAGKVRFIGASNTRAWRLEQARCMARVQDLTQYCCVQQRHTYLRHRPGMDIATHPHANEDLLDFCAYHGITLLAYSPLLGGAYTRADRPLAERYTGPDNEARLSALKAVAAETRATPNQVVLAWMAQSTPPVIPLVAASSEAQMRENLGALSVVLTGGQMQQLDNPLAPA
jgi:aryl-alcohol dehydrogenase-like predicted oxidoreductase